MDDFSIILYSGQGCCLCDEAEALLLEVKPGAKYSKIDVRLDPQNYHLYATRIPILKRQDTAQELAWPFNQLQLREFLS